MTTHTAYETDPITLALTHLASADHHAAAARTHRDDDEHKAAGLRREAERLCLKRAEILVGVAQARALDDLAQTASRIGLAL